MRKLIFSKGFACLTVLLFAIQTTGYSQQAATVTEALKEGEKVGVTAQKEGALGIEAKGTIQAINPYDVTIPEAFGRIEEVFQGAPDSPLIVHVQDAHANYEAQKNIKQILDHLRRNFLVNLIQLEGAASKLDPSIFAISYLKEANQKLADFLMRQGRLSGAEAFAIDSENPVELYGVEDATLYVENLKTFRSVYSHQKELDAYFGEMRLVAKDLRVKLLNEELLDLVRKMEEYSREKIELLDYVLYLNTLAEKHEVASLKDLTELNRFPNLVRIVRLHDLEKEVSDKSVKQEADALKQAFLDKGVTPEEKALIEKLEDPKKGMKPRAYFKKIGALADRLGIDLLLYPKMRKYSEFLILQDEIEHRGLFGEVSHLEKLLQKKLFKTKEEQFLVDLIKGMELLTQYFKLEMNREKLAFVMKRYEKIKPSIIQKRLDYLANQCGVKPSDYKGDVGALDKLMDDVEYFYRIVIERDGHFINNVMNRMKESQTDRTVLITGGFHTDGVTRLLRKDNKSYIVVIPRIDVKQGPENYLKVMLESDTAVGSVFAGSFALSVAVHAVQRAAFLGPIREWLRAVAGGTVGALQISAQEEAKAGVLDKQRLIDSIRANLTKAATIQSVNVQGYNYDPATGEVSLDYMEIVFDANTSVVAKGFTLTSDGKMSGTIEERIKTPEGAFEATAYDLHNSIPSLQSNPAAIVPEERAAVQAQAVQTLSPEEAVRAALVNYAFVPAADNIPDEVLAQIAELPDSAYAFQCLEEGIARGLPIAEAINEALSRSQTAEAVKFQDQRYQGLLQVNAPRMLAVPFAGISPEARNAQMMATWQDLTDNPKAAALIFGNEKAVLQLMDAMQVPQTVRERIIIVQATDENVQEVMDMTLRDTGKLRGWFQNATRLPSVTNFDQGVVRALIPEDWKVEVPASVIRLVAAKEVSKDNLEGVAAMQVMLLHRLPTFDQDAAEFTTLLQQWGMPGVVKGSGNSWSFDIQSFTAQLYQEFLAARLIAIRA